MTSLQAPIASPNAQTYSALTAVTVGNQRVVYHTQTMEIADDMVTYHPDRMRD